MKTGKPAKIKEAKSKKKQRKENLVLRKNFILKKQQRKLESHTSYSQPKNEHASSQFIFTE